MFVTTTLPLSCWPSLTAHVSYCSPLFLFANAITTCCLCFCCCSASSVKCVSKSWPCVRGRERERERVAEPERGGKHGWPHPRLEQTTLFVRVYRPLPFTCISAPVCFACVCVLRFVCAAICVCCVVVVFFLSSKWLCLWRCLLLLPALVLPAAPVII